jgi:Icc-related predicted phosphoesterase
MRVFFASDIHGSTACFSKLIRARDFYKVDAVLMGGDISGKELVPLVAAGSGWTASYRGAHHELATEEEAAEFERRVALVGGYTSRVGDDEMEALRADQDHVEETMRRLIRERTTQWVELADERLSGTDQRIFMGLGNDDQEDLIPLLEGAHVGNAVEGPMDFGDVTLVSLGWSNPTPWHTHREAGEEDLAARLSELTDGLDPQRTVLNVHVPPYASGLDSAPRLDDDLQIQLHGGEPDMIPVGSTAVAAAIREFQPLASLHGHIHESRGTTTIGRTMVLNPGSEYDQAALLGAIVDLRPGKKTRVQLVNG